MLVWNMSLDGGGAGWISLLLHVITIITDIEKVRMFLLCCFTKLIQLIFFRFPLSSVQLWSASGRGVAHDSRWCLQLWGAHHLSV
jgi:hypothetical protein